MKRKLKLIEMSKGSILAALSVTINVFFAYALPTGGRFALPLYVIPIIIASIHLGPLMGITVGFVADIGIGLLSPNGYLPLFVISKIMWGAIPGLIIRGEKKYSFFKLIVATLYAYVMASAANSLALYVYYGKKTFLAVLSLRVVNLLIFTPLMAWITNIIFTSLFIKDKKYLCGVKLNILYDKKN